MKTSEQAFRAKVDEAIEEFKDLTTWYLESQLAIIQRNLKALQGPFAKIVSLREHARIKFASAIVYEVLRDRKGEVRPYESIDSSKPRNRVKTRSGALRISK
jgi:hypothetical protein